MWAVPGSSPAPPSSRRARLAARSADLALCDARLSSYHIDFISVTLPRGSYSEAHALTRGFPPDEYTERRQDQNYKCRYAGNELSLVLSSARPPYLFLDELFSASLLQLNIPRAVEGDARDDFESRDPLLQRGPRAAGRLLSNNDLSVRAALSFPDNFRGQR